jgi:hypothetical protein
MLLSSRRLLSETLGAFAGTVVARAEGRVQQTARTAEYLLGDLESFGVASHWFLLAHKRKAFASWSVCLIVTVAWRIDVFQ